MVERECLLFEAGEYPDRGVTIAPEDLAAIARNTPCPVPVRVEHLRESPFDGALGHVTGLRAEGGKLWGTLRQPAESWAFVRRAGARALSVALDVGRRRLEEVSFVCRPRVASAQVFSEGVLVAELALSDEEDDGMLGVRQFADGVVQYIRSALGSAGEGEALASEREEVRRQREELEAARVEGDLERLKRRGLLRASESTQEMARAILRFGSASVVRFSGEDVPLAALFERFLESNGPVVPMGEAMRADGVADGRASDRLIAMAREAASRDGVPFAAAFSRVAGQRPDLASAAREEGLGG
jgi:hypothetical protein